MTVPRASRITETELAVALKAVRYPPIARSNGMAGASAHYETDHAAHARAVVDAVGSARHRVARAGSREAVE